MEQQDEQILVVEQMSEKNEWVADIAKHVLDGIKDMEEKDGK